MSIEGIIDKLEEMATDREGKILPGCLGYDEIEPLRDAIALLRTHPEAQPNEPLTPDDLLQMGGEPVYLALGDRDEWALVRVQEGKVFFIHKNTICAPAKILFECGGKAYRRPPKEGT